MEKHFRKEKNYLAGFMLASAAVNLIAYPQPSFARCRYTNSGNYVCITKVESYNSAPHLKLIQSTLNGTPITFLANCSNFTAMVTPGIWDKFDINSPAHSVCSEWSR
jgi:hypothetical protein